jgi:hypothetical protein
MVSIEDIWRDVPAWPVALVGEWLHYFANESDLGWPPPEPLGDHRWSKILGGRPLSWWKNVSWKKETVICDPEHLSDKSFEIIETMLREIGARQADDATKRRYQNALQGILEHGVLPGAIVAMRVPSGLEIIDGSHRIGAFCGVQLMSDEFFKKQNAKRPSLQQEVWIGTHAAGEMPLT